MAGRNAQLFWGCFVVLGLAVPFALDIVLALRLRAMHLLYESVRETGGTVVVPSSFSEGFGDVLGDAAKDVLGKGSGL